MHALRRETKAGWIVWVLLLCILFGCLVFHTQYSFCQSDESFYISHVKRLYQGDRLILDEWHPTQFYLPILLPFYAAFRAVTGSDEGIIQFFRIIGVLVSFISSLVFFWEIRKTNNGFISFCVTALLLLFCRANIAGLSYYNLNLHLSILFFVALRNAVKCHGVPATVLSVLSGVFLSLAVLCQPYTAVLYIGIMGYLLINKSTRKDGWVILITVLLMGITYVFLFLFKGNIASYITNIQYVLSDPAHNEGIIASLINILYVYYKQISVPYCFIVAAVSVWFYYTRRKEKPLTLWHFVCQIVLLIIMLVKPLARISTYPCYSTAAFISIAAFPSIVYYFGKKDKSLMTELYILGICLAFFWGLGSNTGLDGMIVGYCISGIGALLLIAGAIRDDMHTEPVRKTVLSVFSCFCVLVLLATLTQRVFGFYRDAPIDQLNTRIEQGPAKGLLTTEESASQYNELYEIINEQYKQLPGATVVHMKLVPWAYLCADWKCYAPTTWTNELNSPRMMEYYRIHDSSLPDVFFVYSPEVGAYKANYFNNHTERMDFNQMEKSGELFEIVNGKSYRKVQKPLVTIYIKNKETEK